MARIYRSDQTVFSFASGEGYPDFIITSTDAGGASTTLSDIFLPGSRYIRVASDSGYAVGDYVQIGDDAGAAGNTEIRRVKRIQSNVLGGTTDILYLDAPLGFYHASGETVDEQASTGIAGDSLVTFIPGVWDSINLPDPVPEITPYYFLGTSSDRNFTIAYKGKKAFNGNVPNFILLNGYSLRFPIGSVVTRPAGKSGGSTTLSADSFKGQRVISLTGDEANFANGGYIVIDDGSVTTTYNPEVRQIISGGGTTTLILDYPLFYNHPATETIEGCTASTTFTHTIRNNFNLDAMSWNVLMRDSDETTANDFIRRYYGGKVNRATISADEGGMLMMSWDEVPFLGLIHNQTTHSGLAAGAYWTGTSLTDMPMFSTALIDPTQESTDFQAVGGNRPHSGGALGEASYPTTEPYYFSQGTLTFFGQTLARVRNFSINVDNKLDARYYLNNDSTERGPYEIIENRREYKMSATIALPDSIAATVSTATLWKELILEGNYTSPNSMQGFAITLTFIRGNNDTITITIPNGGTASTGIDANGAFILSAPHNINPDENPVQVPVDILFRNMSIEIVDSIGTYP